MSFLKSLSEMCLERGDKDEVVELPPELHQKASRNKTLVRLRACRMQMRREGILTIAGYTPPNGHLGADCLALWMRHGWVPPSKQSTK